MSLPRLILAAAAALCLVSVAPAQIRRAAAELPPEPVAPLSWSELVARDARIEFKKPPTDAQTELDSLDLSPAEQELAIFALGAAGALQEWPRLFSHATEGDENLRRAAILGMGELRMGVEAELLKIVQAGVEPYASDAILALARTGRDSARARVERIAAAGGDRGHIAAESLHFVIDPVGSHEIPSARYLLDLRWKSAIRYGTIDGQTWEVQLLLRLAENEEFLDHLILRYAAELPGISVRDHLLNALIERGGRAAVRACVRAMPEQLSQLMLNDLWNPADDGEWDALLRELERNEDLLSDSAGLLNAAFERSPYKARSLRLLAVARDPKAAAAILETFGEYTGEDRVVLLSGLAHFDDARVIDFLRGLKDDADPRVVAQALAGRARGRDEGARDELRLILGDQAHPQWRNYLEMTCHQADEIKIQVLLEALLPHLDGRPRVLVASVLSLNGRIGAREVLRAAVEDGLPQGVLGGLAARALGRRPNSEDVIAVRRIFPLESRDTENLELALALLRRKDGDALKLVLSAALWRGPFDRSVLTARVIIETGNWLALKGELDNVPLSASTRDLRRVGFACGEWGGYPVLEWLEKKRRQGSADPVLQGALLGLLSTRTQ
jgi:hypothetical protein